MESGRGKMRKKNKMNHEFRFRGAGVGKAGVFWRDWRGLYGGYMGLRGDVGSLTIKVTLENVRELVQ